MSSINLLWPKAILLVDMNAFFAAIEQRDNPVLRNQPVAVINGAKGTCIITCSYEARAYGIKTGMRLPEAKLLCPHLHICVCRPYHYTQISNKIMQALQEHISPDIEVSSVDEAFLDITHCQRLLGTPKKIAMLAQQVVYNISGLACSVGVAANKAMAKFAADLQKPNGIVVIPAHASKSYLQNVPVNKMCGIGPAITTFLARYGVYYCSDMSKLPISILAQRFGNLGRRIWLMCQGEDLEPLKTNTTSAKSMGHGKVLPPDTTDPQLIFIYLQHLAERLAERLRRNNLAAQHFFIGLRNEQLGWLGEQAQLAIPTQNGRDIFRLGRKIIRDHWHGLPVYHIQITAYHPTPVCLQADLFNQLDPKEQKLNMALDTINKKFGRATIKSALLLQSPELLPVIAPSWNNSV